MMRRLRWWLAPMLCFKHERTKLTPARFTDCSSARRITLALRRQGRRRVARKLVSTHALVAGLDRGESVAEPSAGIATTLAAEMAADPRGLADLMRQYTLLWVELRVASARIRR